MQRLPRALNGGKDRLPSARSIASGGSSASGAEPEGLVPAGADLRRAAVRAALRAWYATTRRDLPWRHTRDPYAIVVAEFMLQQTQVERVVPKYQAFVARFPTWWSLATALRSEVVRAWAGLGYNRRAVWLHRLAQVVVRRYHSTLPADAPALARLPGLGPYTAAAVACFALGQHVPVVDTNVRRVLGRLFTGVAEPSEHTAWALAAWTLPEDGAADWHQALMDLGATICLARRPACAVCPVAGWCVAQPGVRDQARQVILPGQSRRVGRPRPARQVAEQRSAYGSTFVGSRRYYRGRVIAMLRELSPHATLALGELGPLVRPAYQAADAPWLRDVVAGLVADGLVEWADVGGEAIVRLAEGGDSA